MHNSALAALHVAAKAISTLADVIESTADNDQDSGEVIFSLTNGESYCLKLTPIENTPRTFIRRGDHNET